MTYWPSVLLYSVSVSEDIAFDAVVPTTVEDAGGTTLNLSGLFSVGVEARVAVTNGTQEWECYSGKYGQGNRPIPLSSGLLVAVTPPLTIGGPYDIEVTQGVDTVVLTGALIVVARNWKSSVVSYRKLLPPWIRAGSRSLDVEPLRLSSLSVQYIPDLVGEDAVAFTFTPSTFNPLGAALTWTSIGTPLPGWAGLDAGTGEVSGTAATGTTAGIQLEVTDGVTVWQTNVFSLTVP